MADYKQYDGPQVPAGYPASAPPPPMPGYQPQGPAPWSAYPPPMPGFQSQGPGQWSTGLCDCSDDCGNCCLTFCCPCVTFGRIAEIVDRGSSSCGTSGALYVLITSLTGCQCLYSCAYRTKLRVQYALPESPCNDCLVHCCCEACALCQAYRELQNRGFDMALGWHGNMEKMQGVGMIQPPPMQGAMMR